MNFQFKDVDSKSELIELFKRLNEPKLLIESLDTSPNQYKHLKLGKLNVGLIDHTFGIPIQGEFINEQSIFILGHESEIVAISALDSNILWKVKLDSVFFQFQKVHIEKIIIVIEETGVLALNLLGKKLWSISTDVIVDYQITDSFVFISTFDDQRYSISVRDGRLSTTQID